MNETQRYVPPLAIYILWHPNFTGAGELPKIDPDEDGKLPGSQKPPEKTIAERFVERIKKLLRGPRIDLAESIPIYVRTVSETGSNSGLPKEIDVSQADRTLVVPLIDDTLMTDSSWKSWIRNLSRRQNVHMRPVAISKNGVKLFDGQHPCRLFDRPVDDRLDALLRDLLATCTWLLDGSTPKLFLSYHNAEVTGHNAEATGHNAEVTGHNAEVTGGKGYAADYRGDKIARLLYQTIKHQCGAGVACFFAPESMFQTEPYKARIVTEVGESSALISVLTSQYHERDWCQLEVITARQPREIKVGSNCWTMTPLIVVDGLIDSCSMLWREFGGCYMARWRPESAESTSKEIIYRVLHEVLMSAFYRCWAEKLAGPGVVAINWTPDPLSILKLTDAAGDLPNGIIVYPGHGFSKEDSRFLESTLPGITFRSYRKQIRSR